MRSWSILLLGGLAGCGSYWDLPEGKELPFGCAGELDWYVDADGDNFGDPNTAVEVSCDPIQGRAPNGLDCDDTTASITGRIGTVCPIELGAGEYQTGEDPETHDPIFTYLAAPSDCNAGAVIEGEEYVGTCGSVRIGFTQAVTTCLHWAAWPEDGGDGLAVVNSPSDPLESLLSSLQDRVTDGQDFAVWIDVRWAPGAGDPMYDGGWVLPDGSEATAYPLCEAGFVAADLWPEINFNEPAARANIEAVLPDVRLALRFVGGEWCMGAPPADRAAFPLCERHAPVGLDYQEPADATTEQ